MRGSSQSASMPVHQLVSRRLMTPSMDATLGWTLNIIVDGAIVLSLQNLIGWWKGDFIAGRFQ